MTGPRALAAEGAGSLPAGIRSPSARDDEGIAAQLGDEIRAAVADSQFIFDDRVIPVTVSMGVAEVAPEFRTHHRLVKAADARLYDAKQEGRNRVAL